MSEPGTSEKDNHQNIELTLAEIRMAVAHIDEKVDSVITAVSGLDHTLNGDAQVKERLIRQDLAASQMRRELDDIKAKLWYVAVTLIGFMLTALGVVMWYIITGQG